MKNLQLTNGNMQLQIIATIGNNAFLKRLNDNSFIIVNGMNIHADFTCDWNFAYGYFTKYEHAFNCFVEKIVTPFTDYKKGE